MEYYNNLFAIVALVLFLLSGWVKFYKVVFYPSIIVGVIYIIMSFVYKDVEMTLLYILTGTLMIENAMYLKLRKDLDD